MTQVNLPNPHPGSWDRDNPSQTKINYEVQFLINSVLKDEIKNNNNKSIKNRLDSTKLIRQTRILESWDGDNLIESEMK
jgi:hypothetical protein